MKRGLKKDLGGPRPPIAYRRLPPAGDRPPWGPDPVTAPHGVRDFIDTPYVYILSMYIHHMEVSKLEHTHTNDKAMIYDHSVRCPKCGRLMPLVIVGYDGVILSSTMIYDPNEQGLYHCKYCDWTVEVI